MESKQLTRKLNSIFWWTLSALPLIIFIGIFLSYVINLNTGEIKFTSNEVLNYWEYLSTQDIMETNIIYYMQEMIPQPLFNGIRTILSNFNVNTTYFISLVLSWVIAIQCYHFILDVLLFVIRWAHDLLERGGKRC